MIDAILGWALLAAFVVCLRFRRRERSALWRLLWLYLGLTFFAMAVALLVISPRPAP